MKFFSGQRKSSCKFHPPTDLSRNICSYMFFLQTDNTLQSMVKTLFTHYSSSNIVTSTMISSTGTWSSKFCCPHYVVNHDHIWHCTSHVLHQYDPPSFAHKSSTRNHKTYYQWSALLYFQKFQHGKATRLADTCICTWIQTQTSWIQFTDQSCQL